MFTPACGLQRQNLKLDLVLLYSILEQESQEISAVIYSSVLILRLISAFSCGTVFHLNTQTKQRPQVGL